MFVRWHPGACFQRLRDSKYRPPWAEHSTRRPERRCQAGAPPAVNHFTVMIAIGLTPAATLAGDRVVSVPPEEMLNSEM